MDWVGYLLVFEGGGVTKSTPSVWLQQLTRQMAVSLTQDTQKRPILQQETSEFNLKQVDFGTSIKYPDGQRDWLNQTLWNQVEGSGLERTAKEIHSN